MRPRDQWVVTTQAGCPKQRSKRLQHSGGGAGLRLDPWARMVGALITAPILGVTEPVLANGVASCDISSAVGPSGSTQDLGPGAAENTRAADGTSSRLVNGTDCERHSRPRQGALLPGPNKLYCGAVLGDSPWLLTAARCRSSEWGAPEEG
ncbi:hypothetical protein J1605_021738 [Eschrichtius robustus]|uniref:Peptidase S1 domain-containing protein n=1 Tax=Eschrichtius robustus TaxID=9764 RepID=A0AB34HG77_ESCRO|nr:hypothetical protein J1605_021738 [Eschrichtius robustus]